MVQAKGLNFSFSCFTDDIVLASGSSAAFLCAFYRLACGIVELLDVGVISMNAEICIGGAGGLILHMGVKGSGALSRKRRAFHSVASRLGLRLIATAQPGLRQAQLAKGICPRTGGTVHLIHTSEHEVSAHFEFDGASVLVRENPKELPKAGGASVWVISADPCLAQSLTERLSCLGWKVSPFKACTDGIVTMQTTEPDEQPRLVLCLASQPDELEDVRALSRSLSQDGRTIYAVAAGAMCLGCPDSSWEFKIRVFPLSPQDLIAITEEANGPHSVSIEASGDLTGLDVLIVDDRPLSRELLAAMVSSTGNLPRTVGSGPEAITECWRQAPDLLLMNLRMPGVDGFEATRTVRELQARGDLPPFSILGHTVSWTPEIRRQCIEIGMVDCVSSISTTSTLVALPPYINRACRLH